MSFSATPLEQRIFGIDAPVDNRVIELLKTAEEKVGRYFRNVLPKLKDVIYVIEDLPTYVERGIEKTKDGYRRYLKPIKKIMGRYIDGWYGEHISIDPSSINPNHILRTGGYLSDGTYLYPMRIENLENPLEVPVHELVHGYRRETGTYPDSDIEEGITQFATQEILNNGGAYPLETEAVKRTMKKHGIGEVFYPYDDKVSPSKRRRIVFEGIIKN